MCLRRVETRIFGAKKGSLTKNNFKDARARFRGRTNLDTQL